MIASIIMPFCKSANQHEFDAFVNNFEKFLSSEDQTIFAEKQFIDVFAQDYMIYGKNFEEYRSRQQRILSVSERIYHHIDPVSIVVKKPVIHFVELASCNNIKQYLEQIDKEKIWSYELVVVYGIEIDEKKIKDYFSKIFGTKISFNAIPITTRIHHMIMNLFI